SGTQLLGWPSDGHAVRDSDEPGLPHPRRPIRSFRDRVVVRGRRGPGLGRYRVRRRGGHELWPRFRPALPEHTPMTGQLDPVIHPTHRLKICAMLDVGTTVEMSIIKDTIGLSASALSKQVAALVEAGYVNQERSHRDSRR